MTLFRDHYNFPLIQVDAGDEFLGALAGISDPETKCKIIGKVFIDIFDRKAGKIEGATFLAQGTLCPARQGRHPAAARCAVPRRDPQGRPLRQHLAGVRSAAAGKDRRSYGRRTPL